MAVSVGGRFGGKSSILDPAGVSTRGGILGPPEKPPPSFGFFDPASGPRLSLLGLGGFGFDPTAGLKSTGGFSGPTFTNQDFEQIFSSLRRLPPEA
ncbi:hypothetical protein LCGC14_1705820, partial [marine sediment metagenome]